MLIQSPHFSDGKRGIGEESAFADGPIALGTGGRDGAPRSPTPAPGPFTSRSSRLMRQGEQPPEQKPQGPAVNSPPPFQSWTWPGGAFGQSHAASAPAQPPGQSPASVGPPASGAAL